MLSTVFVVERVPGVGCRVLSTASARLVVRVYHIRNITWMIDPFSKKFTLL